MITQAHIAELEQMLRMERALLRSEYGDKARTRTRVEALDQALKLMKAAEEGQKDD